MTNPNRSMNTSKTIFAAQVVWLAAAVGFWATLIAASWVFMPPLLALISTAVHVVGFMLTVYPVIFCLLGASWRLRGSSRQGSRRGDSSFYPSRDENRETTSLSASRQTSPGSGFNLPGYGIALPLATVRGTAPGEGHPDPLDIPTIWRLSPEARAAGFSLISPMPVSNETGPEEEE